MVRRTEWGSGLVSQNIRVSIGRREFRVSCICVFLLFICLFFLIVLFRRKCFFFFKSY